MEYIPCFVFNFYKVSCQDENLWQYKTRDGKAENIGSCLIFLYTFLSAW